MIKRRFAGIEGFMDSETVEISEKYGYGWVSHYKTLEDGSMDVTAQPFLLIAPFVEGFSGFDKENYLKIVSYFIIIRRNHSELALARAFVNQCDGLDILNEEGFLRRVNYKRRKVFFPTRKLIWKVYPSVIL